MKDFILYLLAEVKIKKYMAPKKKTFRFAVSKKAVIS